MRHLSLAQAISNGMKITPIHTRIYNEGENLFKFILEYLPKIPDRSVIAVTSKIVALSEKRTLIIKNAKTKEQAIARESDWAMHTKYAWLTIKDGMFMASAGIDESNGNGKFVLLPKDSFKACEQIRTKLISHFHLKHLGVIITDSRTAPLRTGVTGVALGFAGFRGLKDYRGKPDIFGRKFHLSQTNVADSLAAAAVFIMGEGNEQQPLILIEKTGIEFCSGSRRKELLINIQDDMYRPLFKEFDAKS